MIVPIDLLEPILEELKLYGRRTAPGRPWLGWMVQEIGRHLVVAGVYEDGPADAAGLTVGNVIAEVAGRPVSGLADLFRRIWSLGPAGVAVPITVIHENEPRDVIVASIDRLDRLKSASVH
jgi:S1-C subfamily serine protease